MKAIFRILGTAAAVAATGAAIVIMDKFLNEKAAPIIESIEFPEEAEKDDAEAAKTAEPLASLLSMAVKPGTSRNFVGKREFEIMKKPGRGTHGHIAILPNNVDRAIYHLSQRGVKFDMDSKNVKDGKTIAIYFADEVAGFAIHLVQK